MSSTSTCSSSRTSYPSGRVGRPSLTPGTRSSTCASTAKWAASCRNSGSGSGTCRCSMLFAPVPQALVWPVFTPSCRVADGGLFVERHLGGYERRQHDGSSAPDVEQLLQEGGFQVRYITIVATSAALSFARHWVPRGVGEVLLSLVAGATLTGRLSMCATVLSVSSPLLLGHLGKRVHLARVHYQVLFHQPPACGAARTGGSPPGHGSASVHGVRRLTSQWPHERPPSKRSWRGLHWTASRRIHSTCGKVLHAILEADVPASIAAPSLAHFSHQQARVDSALAGTHRVAQREGYQCRTDKGVRHQDVASVIGQVLREHTGKHAKSDGPRQGARRPMCLAR